MNSTLTHIDDKELNVVYWKHIICQSTHNDCYEITIISHKKYLAFQNKR